MNELCRRSDCFRRGVEPDRLTEQRNDHRRATLLCPSVRRYPSVVDSRAASRDVTTVIICTISKLLTTKRFVSGRALWLTSAHRWTIMSVNHYQINQVFICMLITSARSQRVLRWRQLRANNVSIGFAQNWSQQQPSCQHHLFMDNTIYIYIYIYTAYRSSSLLNSKLLAENKRGTICISGVI